MSVEVCVRYGERPCLSPAAFPHYSGRKSVNFANGTRKDSYPDGRLSIRFANGDIKIQQATGRVDYFYSEVISQEEGARRGRQNDVIAHCRFDGGIRRPSTCI